MYSRRPPYQGHACLFVVSSHWLAYFLHDLKGLIVRSSVYVCNNYAAPGHLVSYQIYLNTLLTNSQSDISIISI